MDKKYNMDEKYKIIPHYTNPTTPEISLKDLENTINKHYQNGYRILSYHHEGLFSLVVMEHRVK